MILRKEERQQTFIVIQKDGKAVAIVSFDEIVTMLRKEGYVVVQYEEEKT